MLTEVKILFENIKYFRHLLNEGVGEKDIVDAINNHEWIYLYYTGDDKIASGYRTIRPYVLGTHKKSGNKVLRAWQDNPKNSWHFDNKPTRRDSKNHDYWSDDEGDKPGWRLFRVDKITKVLPIGKKFHDSNGLVMIPPGYHEGGDDNMSSIDAYVSTKTQPDFEYKYDKDFHGAEKSPHEQQKLRWDSIRRGNKNKKRIGPDEVIKLRNLVTKFHKKSIGNYLIAIDDKDNFQLITIKDRERYNIPDTAIVGDLPYLYDSLVGKKQPVDDRKYKQKLDKIKSDLSQVSPQQQSASIKETENLPTIPFERKTFFKK